MFNSGVQSIFRHWIKGAGNNNYQKNEKPTLTKETGLIYVLYFCKNAKKWTHIDLKQRCWKTGR